MTENMTDSKNENLIARNFMTRAISLAKLGDGKTNPNPLVGAVIVKNGKIIGEGYHHTYGALHAERDALKNCAERGENPAKSEMFVTLEPCCHYGKQPPCTQAILESGISKVFVGSRDPNPLVSGKGVQFLRENGIEVETDFLKEECDELNPIFFHYITKNLPYVALKYAMTADGKIATKSGKSKWITGEKSRAFVHGLRGKYSAILVGIGTVLADDPMLNCRSEKIENSKNPVRVILDSKLRLPLESKIVQSAQGIKTIVACVSSSDDEFFDRAAKLQEKGVKVWEFAPEENVATTYVATTSLSLSDSNLNCASTPSIRQILSRLATEEKIDSVLVEGGASVNWSFLESGLVNKIYCFVAPKFFGGKESKSPVSGRGIEDVDGAFQFKLKSTEVFDNDILLEYEAD